MQHKGTRKIALTGKRGIGKFALVDSADFLRANRLKWCVNRDGYPTGNIGDKTRKNRCRSISLHRFILNEPDGEVDHINRNKLDARQENLRVVSRSVNVRNRGLQKNNTSGQIGVRYDQGWRAELTFEGQRHSSGRFKTKEEAALARKQLEQKYVTA